MPVLSKQAVLSGPVDFCCLVCETTFQSYEETKLHVETKQHVENFASSSYVEKYAAEHIRKVKQYLYCEACNVVIPSSRKIQNHVSEDTHEFNNTSEETDDIPAGNTFVRCNEMVIAFNDILIEENAWNGIIDESCIVCDLDWEDLQAHIRCAKHVINLIQAQVHSGFGNTLFRKIDSLQFHCLSCNAILPQEEFISHWDNINHKKLHIKCRKAKRALDERKMMQVNSTKENIQIDSNQTENVNIKNSDEVNMGVEQIKEKNVNILINKEVENEIQIVEDKNTENNIKEIKNTSNTNENVISSTNGNKEKETKHQFFEETNMENNSVKKTNQKNDQVEIPKEANDDKDELYKEKDSLRSLDEENVKYNESNTVNNTENPIERNLKDIETNKQNIVNNFENSNEKNKDIQDIYTKNNNEIENRNDKSEKINNEAILNTFSEVQEPIENIPLIRDVEEKHKLEEKQSKNTNKEEHTSNHSATLNVSLPDEKATLIDKCDTTEILASNGESKILEKIEVEAHNDKQNKIIIKKKILNQEELLYNDLNKELDLKSYMLLSDNDLMLCVLCNWEYEKSHYKSHLNSDHHKILENLNKVDLTNINSKILAKTYNASENVSKEIQENLLSYLMNESKFDKPNVDLNLYEVWCKKCKKLLTVKPSQIQLHIEECYNNPQITSKTIEGDSDIADEETVEKKSAKNIDSHETKHKTDAPQKTNQEEELIKFYKENHISIYGRYATCHSCNVEMSYVKKCIKEHINGARHKRNSENYVDSEEESDYAESSDESDYEDYPVLPMKEFVIYWKAVGQDCLINNRLWMTIQSYCMTDNGECFCCEVKFGDSVEDFEHHVNGESHKKNMAQIPVLTSLDNEFVRKLKSNAYHCGFCSLLLDNSRELHHHLRHRSNHHFNRQMFSNMCLMMHRDESLNPDMLRFIMRINNQAQRTYFD